MDHLTSPKLTPGVHCLNLRHKGMFVTSGADPDELAFYDKYDGTAYWCIETQRGFGPDGAPVRPDCCSGERDFETIYTIVNDGAQAYRGIIPADRWTEPYMSREKLHHEIEAGVEFS